MTWGDVVRLGAAWPEVAIAAAYGTPALRVRGKLLTRLRPEDDSLVLLDIVAGECEALIVAEPGIFHTTPHYDGYDIVLARLAPLSPLTLRPCLDRRWRAVAPKRLVAEFMRQPGGCGSGRQGPGA